MVNFDPTISLGHIAELTIVVIGAIGIFFRLESNVRSLKEDVTELRSDMNQITIVITTLARQDERLKSLEHRTDNLERS